MEKYDHPNSDRPRKNSLREAKIKSFLDFEKKNEKESEYI